MRWKLQRDRLHAAIAVLAAVALYTLLPARLTIGPIWVAPALVLVILVPLLIAGSRTGNQTIGQRAAAITLVAIVNFFNVASVILLVYDLVSSGHHSINGVQLLIAGSQIWLTNVIVFSLWFWELDGDGPTPRAKAACARDFRNADFLFPQMNANPEHVTWTPPDWKPQFLDYFYLAFTNATAFSPTDVMPLSRMAKMLMLIQASISLVTIALILARSVNIIA